MAGTARYGVFRFVAVGQGRVCCGGVSFGRQGKLSHGVFRCGNVMLVVVLQERQGQARLGSARYVSVRLGKSW